MHDDLPYKPDGLWSRVCETAARIECLDGYNQETARGLVADDLECLAVHFELLGQREKDLARLLRALAGFVTTYVIEFFDDEEDEGDATAEESKPLGGD